MQRDRPAQRPDALRGPRERAAGRAASGRATDRRGAFDPVGIDRLFSKTVCINLDRRPDRWRRMTRRFEQLGMGRVSRFAAIDGDATELPEAWAGRAGEFGCLASHVAVVASARAEGVESVLILEDDVEFVADVEARLGAALAELPGDWALFYLGGSHVRPPARVGESVARASCTLSTFAYALRPAAFGPILDRAAAGADPIDVHLTRLQPTLPSYCTIPNLAWVEPDYSDVRGCEVNYWFLRESLVVGDGCLDDLAGQVALALPAGAPAWRHSAPGSMDYLIALFHDVVPDLEVVIDRGGHDPIDPDRYARRASACLGERIQYLLVAGSPIHLGRSHLAGAVQLCRDHDLVVPFAESVRLGRTDTERVLGGGAKRLRIGPRGPLGGRELGWGFYRTALARGGLPPRSIFVVPGFALSMGCDRDDGAESDD